MADDQETRVLSEEVRKLAKQVNLEELVEGKNSEKAQQVNRGIERYIQAEKDRIAYEQLRPNQQQPLPEAPRGAKLKPLDVYFSSVIRSADPNITRAMESFRIEAAGQALNQLETEFLVEHYVRLYLLTDEQQIDKRFLKEMQDELKARKIHLKGLEKQAKKRTQQQATSSGQGLLDLSEITNDRLLGIGNNINKHIAAVGEDIEFLNARWGEVNTLVGGLGGVPESEKSILLDEITEVIKRVKNRMLESQRNREEREEKEGWLGYRKVTSEEKRNIQKEIDQIADWIQSDRSHELNAKALKGDVIYTVFNRMFDRADSGLRDDFSHAIGQQGEYERQEFVNAMNEIKAELVHGYEHGYIDKNGVSHGSREGSEHLKIEIISKFIDKFDQEYKMREILHNAFTIAENEGEFKDFGGYCKQFASSYGDLAFAGSPEVETALRVREYVLYQIKRENKGRIPPEKVTYNPRPGGSEWEERTRKMLDEMNKKGLFGEGKEEIPFWKIGRAISISRGMGMVLLRFPSIIAECDVEAPVSTSQALAGSAWQKLVWGLNPMLVPKVYGQGFGMRGFLYAAKNRNKKGLWNQNEIANALAQEAISTMVTMGDDEALINLRNMFNSGGPFNHTGWRPYVAALDESRNGLRPLLDRNPGLAMRLLFNKYEYNGQNKRKWEFMQDDEARFPDKHPSVRLKEWNEIQKANKDGDEKEYKTREREMWKNASKRIPHVMLRIISDRYNLILKQSEILEWKKRLANTLGINYKDDKAWGQVEEDLVLAKENLMQRRRIALLPLDGNPNLDPRKLFPEDEDQLLLKDFDLIGDEDRIRRAIAFKNFMVSEFASEKNKAILDTIVRKAEKGEFAFEVTAEDIPWSEFMLGQTGARGFFTRKINDAMDCAQAGNHLQELIKHLAQFQGPEQIVEALQKIYDSIEMYGKEVAQDSIAKITTGLIRFFEKDGMMKIPLLGELMGPINAMNHRGASFAQTMYGGKAMAWDSDDIYSFTEMLRGMLSDKRGFDLIQKMRKETGGTILQAIGKKTKLAIYLLLLFGTAEMIEKVLKEK